MYIKVTDDDLEEDIFLKRVLAQHVIKTVSHSCKGNFTITCQVGLMKFTLGDGQLDLCKGNVILFSLKFHLKVTSTRMGVLIYCFICLARGTSYKYCKNYIKSECQNDQTNHLLTTPKTK